MENVLYFPFDYHASSKDLSVLLESMSSELQKIGFCWVDKTGQCVREQQGVIRTNCVDCLDRTNVVQHAISHSVVLVQGLKLGVYDFDETPDVLIQLLSSMWTLHGDCLSRQYSGTSALRKHEKNTRHRQKLIGMVKNGVNSAKRYKNAHLHDFSRQFAIDVLTTGKTTTKIKNDQAELNAKLEAEGSSESSTDAEEGNSSNDEAIASVSKKINESQL